MTETELTSIAPPPRVDAKPETDTELHRHGIFVLWAIFGVIALSCIVDWLNWLMRFDNLHQTLTGSLLVPALVCCVILFPLALQVAWHFRRHFISVDDHGVTIYRLNGNKYDDTRYIPWKDFRAVHIVKFGPEHMVRIITRDSKEHGFFSRHLKESMDPAEFFSAVRAWAPDSLPDNMEVLSGESNYTRLWFDSFTQTQGRHCSGELQIGTQLQDGKYSIVANIGQGGQGTAYLADTTHTLQTDGLPAAVVLKEYILPMHHFKTQSILTENAEKLHKEATILERIDHEQIVRLFGHFVEDFRGYLVMEHIEGVSLKDLVASEGKQPEPFVMDIASQICDILTYLHGLSPPILHRDLTPDNLILQTDGKVKLVDFNVAHQMESSATATVVGKHTYIPPEQFKGKPTPQSDVYALGCTMHFLLTGEEPEPLTVSSPRLLRQEISSFADNIVRTATAIDTSARFASAKELQKALRGKHRE